MNVIDDSEVYVQLYPNQFRHLNRLVEAQKECQKKFAEVCLFLCGFVIMSKEKCL